jgi:hypothetical protein
MAKSLKVYPITLAKHFQRPHPRTGDETNFKERVLNGFGHQYRKEGLIYTAKFHTGRENYDLWKHRCDEVNAGRGVMSLRQWKGMPYRTGQTPIGLELTKVGIQRMRIEVCSKVDERFGPIKIPIIFIDGRMLKVEEMLSWFEWKNWEGALIHFHDFKY